ncbi:hypothetical protein GN956_G906 [Arapaima gigas]
MCVQLIGQEHLRPYRLTELIETAALRPPVSRERVTRDEPRPPSRAAPLLAPAAGSVFYLHADDKSGHLLGGAKVTLDLQKPFVNTRKQES